MNTNEENLQLRFDPRTIEHLGIKMYSQLPYALAELVANAYRLPFFETHLQNSVPSSLMNPRPDNFSSEFLTFLIE